LDTVSHLLATLTYLVNLHFYCSSVAETEETTCI